MFSLLAGMTVGFAAVARCFGVGFVDLLPCGGV